MVGARHIVPQTTRYEGRNGMIFIYTAHSQKLIAGGRQMIRQGSATSEHSVHLDDSAEP